MRTFNNEIGVMQSRLSPLGSRAYQAFPPITWEAEFSFAKAMGFKYIEWIFDNQPENLLRTPNGPMDILRVGMDNQVLVRAVCADYFIKDNFTQDNPSKAIAELNHLIVQCYKLGVRNIVLPCLEDSSLGLEYTQLFAKNIQPCLDIATQYWVNICIESDLPPDEVVDLIKACKSSRIKICYDTGNSASLGYNINEEFEKYGQHIAHVHLKDRLRGGPNVEIGTGDCDFEKVFNNLKKVGYDGFMTLQSARASEDLYQLSFTGNQFSTIKSLLSKVGENAPASGTEF